ncbi:MAG: hypothetical protein EBS58_02420, partial [Micrococcales bacterium]|nr:hypothetical protein [Micrococcales bacterium]
MRVASVVFASPLPQLDKEFDYFIPTDLEASIQFGSLVSVPFGKSKTTKTGYVVGIKNESEYGSELASVSSVESSLQLITPEQWDRAQRCLQTRSLSRGVGLERERTGAVGRAAGDRQQGFAVCRQAQVLPVAARQVHGVPAASIGSQLAQGAGRVAVGPQSDAEEAEIAVALAA